MRRTLRATDQIDAAANAMLLHHAPESALKQASAFLGRCSSMGSRSLPGKYVPALPVLCLHLACQLASTPFDEKVAARHAMLSGPEYARAIGQLQRMLRIAAPEPQRRPAAELRHTDPFALVDALATRFRLESAAAGARALLGQVEKLAPAQRRAAMSNMPACVAAAMISSALKLGRRLPRTDAAAFAGVSEREIRDLVALLGQLGPGQSLDETDGENLPPSQTKEIPEAPMTPSSRQVAAVKRSLQEATFNTPTMGRRRIRSETAASPSPATPTSSLRPAARSRQRLAAAPDLEVESGGAAAPEEPPRKRGRTAAGPDPQRIPAHALAALNSINLGDDSAPVRSLEAFSRLAAKLLPRVNALVSA